MVVCVALSLKNSVEKRVKFLLSMESKVTDVAGLEARLKLN